MQRKEGRVGSSCSQSYQHMVLVRRTRMRTNESKVLQHRLPRTNGLATIAR